MANDLTVTQIASIVNSIMDEVTGVDSDLTQVNTATFVSVAQTALKTGYDPLAVGLSVVMTNTIMSVRPYNRKFRGLMRSEEEWGNHTRKIQFVDQPATDNGAYKLVNGQSVDMYKVNLEKVLQTNFYGQETFDFYQTFTRNQLKSAMRSPTELARYYAAKMMHIANQREQRLENLNRFTINNLIAGKVEADSTNVLHLVTMYNTEKGTSLTSDTVRENANWGNFSRWMYGKLETLASMLTERSQLYHLNINDYPIKRHTPYTDLTMYMIADFENAVNAEVLSQTYHDSYLRFADHEKINFWQNPNEPYNIDVFASYTGKDGALHQSKTGGTQVSHVVGIMMDREAAGSTIFDEHSNVTPNNAFGDYYNQAWKGVYRFWNDLTENCLVLCLD